MGAITVIDAKNFELDRLQQLADERGREVEHLREDFDILLAAARCIRHWHDSGHDNEGMVISASHVRELWTIIEAVEPRAATPAATPPEDEGCECAGICSISGTAVCPLIPPIITDTLALAKPPAEERPDTAVGECVSCEECGGEDSMEVECDIPEKCTASKRPCGHHCNHIWSNESCCWCGIGVTENEARTAPEAQS